MRRSIIVLVLLGLSSFAGCRDGASSRQSLVRLVPADSLAVLSVNWTAVRNDGELRRIAQGAEIIRILSQLDISDATVSDVVIFGDAQNLNDGTSGMLLRGTYKSREVVGRLKGRGWSEQEFDGHKVYRNPANGALLTALGRNLIALGSRAGVEATINVKENPRRSFAASVPYKRMASGLAGKQSQYPVMMMVALPQEAQDAAEVVLQATSLVTDLAGVGGLGELLKKIGYVRGVTCTFSRNGDAFPVELVAIMRDEGAASLASGTITVLKQLPGFMPQQNLSPAQRKAKQNIDDISVKRNGDVLSIKMIMDRADLMTADD